MKNRPRWKFRYFELENLIEEYKKSPYRTPREIRTLDNLLKGSHLIRKKEE